MIKAEQQPFMLPNRIAEFRQALETKRLVLVHSAGFLLDDRMFDQLLSDPGIRVAQLSLDGTETYETFQDAFIRLTAELFELNKMPESITGLLDQLEGLHKSSIRGLVAIHCREPLGYLGPFSGFINDCVNRSGLPLTLYIDGPVTAELYLGNLLLKGSIAEFSCESFYMSKEDAGNLLEYAGMSHREISDVYDFCGGDLGAILTFASEKQENPYYDPGQTKEKILKTARNFLFEKLEDGQGETLAHLSVFARFNLQMLDDYYDGQFDALPVFRFLRAHGVVVSDQQGYYFLLPFVRDLLQEERIVRSNRQDRQQYEKRAIQALKHEGKLLEAVDLAVWVKDSGTALLLAERIAYKAFCKMDVVQLRRVFEALPDSLFEDEPLYACLELVLCRMEGDLNRSAAIAGSWDDLAGVLRRKGSRWSVFALFFSVISLLDSYRFREASEQVDRFLQAGELNDPLQKALVEVIRAQILLLQGDGAGAERFYHRNARILEAGYDGDFWNMLLLSLLGQVPLHYMRDSRQSVRSLEDSARKAMKRGDQTGYIWYKSTALMIRLSMGEKRISCRDTEDFLVWLEAMGEQSGPGAGGLFLGALYRSWAGERPEALRYLHETIYQSNRSGNTVLAHRALLQMARVLREEGDMAGAAKILDDLENITDYGQSPVNRSGILLERARQAELEGEPLKSYDLYSEAVALNKQIGYYAGRVNAMLEKCRSMHAGRYPAEEITGLFQDVLKVAKTYDCVYLIERERQTYAQLYRYVTEQGVDDPMLGVIQDPDAVADTPVQIRLFGEFQVSGPGGTLLEEDWPTRKVRGLLHYLLIHQEERVARERLAELFWPDVDDQAQASSNLRVALSLLGKTLKKVGLGEMLHRNRQKAWIELPEGTRVDVYEAQGHLEQGRKHLRSKEFALGEEAFRQALDILEQPYLETQTKERWAQEERSRMHKKRDRTIYLLLKISLMENKMAKAEKYCLMLLGYDRYREDVHVTLVGILKKQGRTGEALQTYKNYRRILKEELKVKPSARIVKLAAEMAELGI